MHVSGRKWWGGWVQRVYGNSFQGLKELWGVVVGKTIERLDGFTQLSVPEYLTIPMPASLDPASPDLPVTFAVNTSRPSTLIGLDQGSVREVLSITSQLLNRDFNIAVSTRFSPKSALGEGGVKENIKRLVLVGASNLKRVAAMLQDEGYEVIDLCIPGWRITPENISELEGKLKNIGKTNNTAIVMDLFGNSSFRVKLFDGSSTLPMKGGGGLPPARGN